MVRFLAALSVIFLAWTTGAAAADIPLKSFFGKFRGSAVAETDAAKKLDAGEGTAGQLLKDKQLYENMNGAVGDLRELVADIRKDPRKFLNIKVSVF